MKILEELYYGNISPVEKEIIKDSEYDKINQRVNVLIEKFMKELNNKQRTELDDIIETYISLANISETDSFIEGFCLGSKIMLEVSNYKSRNFKPI